MKKVDIYDIFLESIGWSNPGLSISDSIIIQNEEALTELAQEIGFKVDQELFDLFLVDDDVHDMIEATLAIYELGNQFDLGFDNEESIAIMQETHFTGESRLASGSYTNLNQMKEVLNNKEFSCFIRKIEK